MIISPTSKVKALSRTATIGLSDNPVARKHLLSELLAPLIGELSVDKSVLDVLVAEPVFHEHDVSAVGLEHVYSDRALPALDADLTCPLELVHGEV